MGIEGQTEFEILEQLKRADLDDQSREVLTLSLLQKTSNGRGHSILESLRHAFDTENAGELKYVMNTLQGIVHQGYASGYVSPMTERDALALLARHKMGIWDGLDDCDHIPVGSGSRGQWIHIDVANCELSMPEYRDGGEFRDRFRQLFAIKDGGETRVLF